MNSVQPTRQVATALPGGGVRIAPRTNRYRRTRRSELVIWWREIDRVLLALVLMLVTVGTVAVAASSPASAHRLSTQIKSLGDLYFFWIHLRWLAVGLFAMFVASLLPKETTRRLAIILAAAMLVALVLVPFLGNEVKGAKRWLWIGFSLQPSEFLKPGFAIAVAWILSWKVRDPNIPVIPITIGLMLLIAALLMAQPDFGSTVLFGGVWFVLVLLSGLDLKKVGWSIAGGIAGVILAYFFYPNATHRIDAFLSGGSEFDQVDLAMRTLVSGGWSGSGLWLGSRKMALPEAHTDYIFSVIGEEFGLIACALIVVLYCAIVIRVMMRLADEEDLFTVLAAAGLTAQLAGQAFINILVNLQLFPSKGMTLPLISYGGSSTIALLLGVGFLLAITRRNPYLSRETSDLRELVRT
ncbi:MAG: putative lipid II flippase FtsW [Sphingomonadales bacterium]|uniref:FtsW/RodA/SpoVE family cell cycle protein n=1 Tax=Novosphingobium sp. AAP93 TaxID=1523427 RepID=UPI0006B93F86|nr:putative peptidoglycan glycosyltransferase FtsW [Novosphingobium sp. AAP93]KPF89357.1 cell division protein FtsW [Novosphingobium sp. AAP93]MBU6393624.1 putative lipid II flippase FtsW [Sphingomonadales bacterium]